MFMHNKRLMYTVRVDHTDPRMANLILEQFGGPDGELAAAMRYFTQGLVEVDPGRKDMLLDIATEELSHLEVVGNLISMLNRGNRSAIAEGEETADVLSTFTQGNNDSHVTSLLFGAGVPLTNSAGVPWTSAYVDSRTEPSADFRSNIAAEARAKVIYERLINLSDDPGVKDALGFLMTREIAHQKSFEKALYAIKDNFPSGKLPGNPEFTDKYYKLSQGAGEMRGPWNEGEQWEYIDEHDAQMAVDGGDGTASVGLTKKEQATEKKLNKRTESDPEGDPTTGADLGAGPGAGSTKELEAA